MFWMIFLSSQFTERNIKHKIQTSGLDSPFLHLPLDRSWKKYCSLFTISLTASDDHRVHL